MSEIWVTMAACTSLPRFCMWSGAASEAWRNAETGDLKCPKCRAAVTVWRVDQAKEMAALRQERQVGEDEWLMRTHEQADRLKAQNIASDGAQQRVLSSVDVIERRGGGRYAAEARAHFEELVKRAIANREG